MFENLKKLSACVFAVFIGVLVGREVRHHFFTPARHVASIAPNRSVSKASVVVRGPTVRLDYSYKTLTISQITSEVDKPGYPDDRYMIGQWFSGRGELLVETKRSLELATKGLYVDSGVSHFTLSDDFHDAVSDEDKRRIFHDYTRARLYNMLMLLEVAKRRELIPKVNHPVLNGSGAEKPNLSR